MDRLTSQTRLAAPDPEILLAGVRARLNELELPVEEAESGFVCTNVLGRIRVERRPGAVAFALDAPTASDLHMLRETVRYQLGLMDAPLAEALEWDGDGEWAGPPPNFRVLTLKRSSRISPGFARLRLRGERLGDFARQGLHVRLALPPEGREPVWPTMGKGGRAIWPSGSDALHTPAYTIRRIDPEAGWLDVDIYLHGNGPTCAWAERAVPGALVGMSGPGGGWFPQARALVFAGDETALPAIGRMLEVAPYDTTGTVLVELADPADRQEIHAPPGVALHWLDRGRDAPLVDAVRELALAPEAHLWFAAEKAQAAKIRQHVRETLGRPKGADHVAGYWVSCT